MMVGQSGATVVAEPGLYESQYSVQSGLYPNAMKFPPGIMGSPILASSYIAQKYVQTMCGVGITFDQEKDSNKIWRVFVKKIRAGSPAETENIREGDTVVTVFGKNVYGLSMTTLRQIIPGQEGTTVKIGFQSKDGTRSEFELLRTGRNMPAETYTDGSLYQTGDSYAAKDDTPVEKNEANKSQKPSAGDDNVPGWEKKFDPKGFVFWVNHEEKMISYTRPEVQQ